LKMQRLHTALFTALFKAVFKALFKASLAGLASILVVIFPVTMMATAAYGADPTAAELESNPSHSIATLVSDVQQVKDGVPFKVAARLVMLPGWHTYYKEAGDAGMPTRVVWTLPPGFKASELIWQKPSKFTDAGITTYGYNAPNLTGATITPPANFSGPVKIKAHVSWLCCKDICIPGKADLTLTLPQTDKEPTKSSNAADFEQLGWAGKVTDLVGMDEKKAPAAAVSSTSTNASPPGASGPGAPSSNTSANSTTPLNLTNSSNVADSGDSLLTEKLDVQGEQTISLPLCFLFALIGGFILNFMPCVLPVIALKVVGIVEQAHGDRALIQKHALAFTAGMIGTFLLLAGILIAVRAAGGSAGWGFLFQLPGFLIGMCVVVLLFALSLFGLFYISLPNQDSVDKLASRNDLIGTFFKGVLATVLSTPCTAPFLGTALGFAFTQSSLTIALIFLTIGVGMALPYFVLLLRPDMLKFIPKPGVWMERFKESMGFVLMATVVWLLYILGQTTGTDGVIRAVAFLVAISFAAWIIASFTNLSSSSSRKSSIWAVALSVVALSFYACYGSLPGYGLTPVKQVSTAPSGGATGAIDWKPYDLSELDKSLKAGKTVFVDFTADWCLTCKVNERTVLDSKPVTDKLKALNVVTMQADYTNQSPAIGKILAKFNRSGVPLYIVFPGKNPTKPIVLPEVITQDLVLKALDQAGASS
jgi:thiol:disulfide interchange protein